MSELTIGEKYVLRHTRFGTTQIEAMTRRPSLAELIVALSSHRRNCRVVAQVARILGKKRTKSK